MYPTLPPSCEPAILEQFLRAEAMAMDAVCAAQVHAPPHALGFLKQHEEEERAHLKKFEELTGIESHPRDKLPKVPSQWHSCAVMLYGYEALGLEFAKLLVLRRPDLMDIKEDEEIHVAFFESEVRKILTAGGDDAEKARQFAQGWMRRVPKTVGRYVDHPSMATWRDEIVEAIMETIRSRFATVGLTPKE